MALQIPAPEDVTLDFLDQLYRDVEGEWLTLFSLDRTTGQRYVDWAPVADIDQLATVAYERAATCCVWLGVATRKQRLGNGSRGGAKDCAHITALWVDIDVAGPNHADNDRLPPTLTDAWQLVNDFPLPPTVIVDTGGGLQPWWFLTEPLAAIDAQPLLERWGYTWQQIGNRHNWHLDAVWDIARIMRLPGTANLKTEPHLVTILDANWNRRYDTDHIDQYLTDPPPPEPTTNRNLSYIGPERPGEAYNARHTGAEILQALGCTLGRRDTNGDEHWVRPGKEPRDGTSATVYADDGHTTIWSTTLATHHPALQTLRPYDPFGLYVATKHNGDFTAAATALRTEGYGSTYELPNVINSNGTEPPPPDETLASRIRDRLLTADQVIALPPPEWLLDGVLVQNTLAVIYGKPNGGKTFVALDWALSIATGAWWFGRKVAPGPVLYVVAEGVAGIGRRLTAWSEGRRVAHTNDIVFYPAAVNLLNPAHAEALAQVAAELTPILIVIDTLARNMAGGDENSAKDMGIVVQHLDNLRTASGACVLPIHHGTKADGSLRGSTALEGAADTTIECKGAEGRIRLIIDKQKDAATGAQHNLYLTPIGASCYLTDRPGPGHDFGLSGKQQDVLDALSKIDDGTGVSSTTWQEMSSSLGVSHGAFFVHKKDLMVQGIVQPIGKGRYPRFTLSTSTNESTDDF